ncbi:MAG: peptidoglycan DD-metalloendopeptidase family protein [Candidatus Peregrinibacteria bacterium]
MHWLSRRVRLLCGMAFIIGSLLPPYVPRAALASQEFSETVPQYLLVEEGFLMKSASLTRQGTRRAYAEGIVHTVKEGESLEKLAQRYHLATDTIRWANPSVGKKPLQPGDELIILPVDGVLHTVGRGQTVTQIAELYDVDQASITKQNTIKGGFLMAGQELIIPGGKPIVAGSSAIAMAGKPVTFGDRIGSVKKPTDLLARFADDGAKPMEAAFVPDPTAGVLQKPCSAACFITQYYHAGHYALDLQERGGGPIYAAEAGTVIRADYGWNGGFGNVIEIDHGNELVSLYGHNKELYVKVGDTVSRGQLIAAMGATGLVYGATGIHTHFEVRLKGVKKNPLLYIQ